VTLEIDVIDLSDPTNPKLIASINLTRFNGASNSVATCNGKLAVALEATPNKQDWESSRFDTKLYRN
jgi:hypothetical protein